MANVTCTEPDTIAAPTSLAASTNDDLGLEVSWVSPTNINYRSVELWYSTSSGGTYTLLTSYYGEPNTAKRVSIGLPSGLAVNTTYYFKVRSVNIYGSQSALTSAVSGSFTLIAGTSIEAESLSVDRIEQGTSTTQSNLLFGFGTGASVGSVSAAGVFGSTVSTGAANERAVGLIVVANGPQLGIGVANVGSASTDYAVVAYGNANAAYTTAVTSGALGTNDYGVQGYNNITAKYGRLGLSSYGVYSSGDVYTTGSYLPFTGSHDALLPKATSVEAGDVLVDTGMARKVGVSETLSYVDKSSSANQKSVIGVYQSNAPSDAYPITLSREITIGSGMKEFKDNELDPDYASLLESHHYIYTNSLGEGQVNVCGESGDIAIGDLIASSGTAGKGMKQADDVIKSSTVCKAREAITFAQASDTGQIACIYLCG